MGQQQAVNTYTPIDQNRCVTAQYEIRDETNLNWWEKSWWGYTVNVNNYAETETGESLGGKLCADYDEETPSQLTVAPCFLPQIFGGPQYVVDGETDCGLNGTDTCCKTGDGINRSGLWIFTRQRNPPETLVKEVRTIAKQMGFSTSVLFNVTHDSNCNVPGIDDKESITILGQNNVRFLRH